MKTHQAFQSSIKRLRGGSQHETASQQTAKIDEFRLLTEIVRHERVNFLQLIADKGFF